MDKVYPSVDAVIDGVEMIQETNLQLDFLLAMPGRETARRTRIPF